MRMTIMMTFINATATICAILRCTFLASLHFFVKCFLVGSLFFLSVQSQASDWRYSVRPGDTLWSVCQEYTVYENCWRELAGHNQMNNPQQLPIGTLLLIPVEWLKQAPVAAQAVYILGDVSFSSSHKKPAELIAGQALRIGSKIVVGQGSATLRFADGATIVMSANSELIIDSSSAIKQAKAQSIEVSLPRGEVQVTVPKRMPRTQFRIKTPTAVAAVRGTQFRVSSAAPTADSLGGQTRSEVLEGVVSVNSSSDSQNVTAGHGVSTMSGQGLSEQVALLAAPRWNRSCNDPGYVEWQISLAATQYRLALMVNDTKLDQVLSTVTVTDSSYVFKELEEGCYQVKVNAVDSQGYNGLESRRQLCYEARLSAPKITEAEFSHKGLLVVWDAVEDAMRYRVDVSNYEDFSSLITSQTIEDLTMSMPLDADLTSLYVRVKAMADDMDDSVYSEAVYLEKKNNNNLLIGILATVLAFIIL